ncbi:MAG: TauD/TfdA family dioxygenase [Novosphingobium sp.]|nr:TauD/TfdA family dioxygenase [Novosphingobium sp.]
MTSTITISQLSPDLAFGARIAGVTFDTLAEPAVRDEINAVFEDRGLIVFDDVEPSAKMHVAISNVFGPLKDHPSPAVPRVDQDGMPGVIDMTCRPNEPGLVEIGGRVLAQWLPWHFDHCYNNELNRARIECRNVLYRMNVIMENLRFGRPGDFAVRSEKPISQDVMDAAAATPRAVHPAVWTRKSGEKVLHVSPWMAEGIEGEEDAEGDALLDAVCREIFALAGKHADFHQWRPTDMLIWDNWRVLHSVTGHDPQYGRRMQRTTIKGDYGLGHFEGSGTGSKVLEMTF